MDRAELAERAAALDTTLDHVYALDVPGFTLATQSVSPSGDDGFQATYVSAGDGRMIHLDVEEPPKPVTTAAATAPGAPEPDEK